MSEGGISFGKTPGSGGGGGQPGGGGGGGDQPDFQVIRTSQPASGGAPPTGLIAGVLAIALIGAGYFLFAGGGGGGGDKPTDANPVAVPPPQDVEVPQAILDQIDFQAGENLEAALVLAEEKLEDYPSQEIRDRISRFRQELGLGLSANDLLKQAQDHAKQQQWADAIAKADQVLANEEENKKQINARAYYLRGACKGFSGERSAAVDDLNQAVELGFEPKAQAQKLIKQWSN